MNAKSEIPKRRWSRYSLRTLIALTFLMGSACGLWRNWTPWSVERVFPSRDAACIAGTYSADGTRVIAAMDDGTVDEWTVATGVRKTLLNRNGERFESVVFAPDLRRMVSFQDKYARPRQSRVGRDLTVHVWNLENGIEQAQLKGHTATITAANFAPDDLRLVTAGNDGTTRIWNAVDGTEMLKLDSHNESVWDAKFSPDSKRVLTAGSSAWIWNAGTGTEIVSVRPSDKYWSAAFSVDGQNIEVLAAAWIDGDARNAVTIYDGNSGRLVVRRAAIAQDMYSHVKGSAWAAHRCSCTGPGPNGSLAIVDPVKGTGLAIIDREGSEFTPYALSPDNSHIAIFATHLGGVTIWRRHRPEHEWGIVCLPEFWLTALFAGVLAWSVCRDRSY